jgi:hypothetical protein
MINFFLGVILGAGAILAWLHYKPAVRQQDPLDVVKAHLEAFGQVVSASEQRVLGEVAKAMEAAKQSQGG